MDCFNIILRSPSVPFCPRRLLETSTSLRDYRLPLCASTTEYRLMQHNRALDYQLCSANPRSFYQTADMLCVCWRFVSIPYPPWFLPRRFWSFGGDGQQEWTEKISEHSRQGSGVGLSIAGLSSARALRAALLDARAGTGLGSNLGATSSSESD